MIQTQHLAKTFSTGHRTAPICAVQDLTLNIADGEVFGFLGPNGAGKTTTVRMLSALISPTSGNAYIDGLQLGKDNDLIRRRVGLLTETPGMYERLSAQKNLMIFANLYGVSSPAAQVEKYLRLLGLWDRRASEVGTFSKGMRQKLAIARALLNDPDVLFLDEPTSGLDPQGAETVHEFIEQLKSAGRTIFLCTHNLDEAERLCNRVAIFQSRALAIGEPRTLARQLFGEEVTIRLAHSNPAWSRMLTEFDFVHGATASDHRLTVRIDHPEAEVPIIVRRLVEAGAEIQAVTETPHSLGEIYLAVLHNQTEGANKDA